MKKIIYTAAILFAGYIANAQVGIGTITPETTSMLDITSTTKGFLMPRMTTGQRTAITSPATGLQVFDITTNSVWYYNGTVWVNQLPDLRAVGTAATASHITQDAGNGGTGTNAGTNGQNIGIGFQTLNAITSGFWNVAAGYTALASNTSGTSNIALGYQALQLNTSGQNNIAIGTQALTNGTLSSSNIAIGGGSLNKIAGSNATAQQNTAVGHQGLNVITTGIQNTAIGNQALLLIASGSQNTVIGHRAGSNLTSGTGNIAIGATTSLATATGSNQLNIGNAIFGTGLTGTVAAPAGNIGIGTTAPATKLAINGSFSTSVSNPAACGCTTGSGAATTSDVPLTTSHFTLADGNFAYTVILPAGAVDGQTMIISSRATLTSSISNANTALPADISLITGQAYQFVYVSGAWLRML